MVDRLPEEASWDDLMYQLYVRQAVEQGLADSDADRTIPVKDVRGRLDLSPSAGGLRESPLDRPGVRPPPAIRESLGTTSRLYADRAVERWVARSEQLEAFLESGRRVVEFDRPDVREIIVAPYRLVYRVRTDQVDVPAVVHERQQLPSDADDL